jgi:DNA-binding MarR family transcriptional regulator
MSRSRPIPAPTPPDATDGIGFLLSQVGSHTSARFAERLEPLGFKPAHVGVLRVIQEADGLSQQALGERIGMFPSRLVGIIDEMEKRGLVERRNSPTDRRSYALYLTEAGRAALEQIGRVSGKLQEEVFASLSDAEKAQMAEFLRRIVAEQGLTPGVHPALGRMSSGDLK